MVFHICQRSEAFLSSLPAPEPVVVVIHYAIFKYNLLLLEPKGNQKVCEVPILWQANVR